LYMADRCRNCPYFLRAIGSCPWRPEYLAFNPISLLLDPSFLAKLNSELQPRAMDFPTDDPELKALYFQGTELYRPMLIGQPLTDEILYYTIFLMQWLFEMFVVCASVLMYYMIPIYVVAYLCTRKSGHLRVLIILVQLKIVSLILSHIKGSIEDLPQMVCTLSGGVE
jgi:hypothetical protein